MWSESLTMFNPAEQASKEIKDDLKPKHLKYEFAFFWSAFIFMLWIPLAFIIGIINTIFNCELPIAVSLILLSCCLINYFIAYIFNMLYEEETFKKYRLEE